MLTVVYIQLECGSFSLIYFSDALMAHVQSTAEIVNFCLLLECKDAGVPSRLDTYMKFKKFRTDWRDFTPEEDCESYDLDR